MAAVCWGQKGDPSLTINAPAKMAFFVPMPRPLRLPDHRKIKSLRKENKSAKIEL